VPSFLSWCRSISRISSVPGRLDSAERGIHAILKEVRAVATDLELSGRSHQAMNDAIAAADAERRLVIEELQRLGVSHQALVAAIVAADAERTLVIKELQRLGASHEVLAQAVGNVAARTDEVARASAKALGVTLTAVVDTQKELLDLVLEKRIDTPSAPVVRAVSPATDEAP
jgi:seryl-tRNA synthetase